MAIIVQPEDPNKPTVPPLIPGRGTWQIGPVQTPVAKASSTAVRGDYRPTRTNLEGLGEWYPPEQVAQIKQLPGMRDPHQRVAHPIDVDPQFMKVMGAGGMVSGTSDYTRPITITLASSEDLPYTSNVMAHELGHNAVRGPRGNDLIAAGTEIIRGMPPEIRAKLPDHLAGKQYGRLVEGDELASTGLEAVRTGAYRTTYEDGKIRTTFDTAQRAFPHPRTHPDGMEAGMNQMIEHITGRSLNSVKNPEVRILMEVAKEYKPLRDWLKRLYETYGAVQVPGKVRVDNNRFVINNSELA